MNLKNIKFLIIWTIIVAGCTWFLNEYLDSDKPEISIIPGPIVDNHEKVDVDKLKIEELKKLVDCYANQNAYLKLFMLDNDTMRAEAKLCNRTWHRDAKIKVKMKKNFIVGNVSYPLGGSVAYYRKFGKIALGGGAYYINNEPGLMFGALYSF